VLQAHHSHIAQHITTEQQKSEKTESRVREMYLVVGVHLGKIYKTVSDWRELKWKREKGTDG